jgi:hypothetical protein
MLAMHREYLSHVVAHQVHVVAVVVVVALLLQK